MAAGKGPEQPQGDGARPRGAPQPDAAHLHAAGGHRPARPAREGFAASAARGKWALLAAQWRPCSISISRRRRVQPRRRRAACRCRGGPASIVAPAGLQQRLEQPRQRTVHARNHYRRAARSRRSVCRIARRRGALLSVLCSISLPSSARRRLAWRSRSAARCSKRATAAATKPLNTALLHRGRIVATRAITATRRRAAAARARFARRGRLRPPGGG